MRALLHGAVFEEGAGKVNPIDIAYPVKRWAMAREWGEERDPNFVIGCPLLPTPNKNIPHFP